MSNDLFDANQGKSAKPEQRLIHTHVVDNCDNAGLGRVMVRVPWLDSPVAAKVAVPTAGNNCGTFMIPQVDDEVLVAVGTAPDDPAYVIGSLWTSKDVPPRRDPKAAANVQVIRTPGGHEVELDDAGKSVTITTMNNQRVRLSQNGVEIRTSDEDSAATLLLKANGDIVVTGNNLTIQANQALQLKGASIDIQATGTCSIKGSHVGINDP